MKNKWKNKTYILLNKKLLWAVSFIKLWSILLMFWMLAFVIDMSFETNVKRGALEIVYWIFSSTRLSKLTKEAE